MISTEDLDLIDLNNPIVLIGFALTSIMIGAFILVKLTARTPHSKDTDLDKT